jgi:hypothetical protein
VEDGTPAATPHWQDLDDATLLAHLRIALQAHEECPTQVREMAKACFTLRDLDTALATLVDDSLTVVGPRVRSTATPRLLSFRAEDLEIEVELMPTPDGWRLIGQLSPAESVRIQLRRPPVNPATGRIAPQSSAPEIEGIEGGVDTDAYGRFALDADAGGPVSLIIRRPHGRSLATSWVLLD